MKEQTLDSIIFYEADDADKQKIVVSSEIRRIQLLAICNHHQTYPSLYWYSNPFSTGEKDGPIHHSYQAVNGIKKMIEVSVDGKITSVKTNPKSIPKKEVEKYKSLFGTFAGKFGSVSLDPVKKTDRDYEDMYEMFVKINNDCALTGESVVPFTDVEYYTSQIMNVYNLGESESRLQAQFLKVCDECFTFRKKLKEEADLIRQELIDFIENRDFEIVDGLKRFNFSDPELIQASHLLGQKGVLERLGAIFEPNPDFEILNDNVESWM